MKQQLTARQTQQLALTPQLRQALAVLQMSSAELEIEIANAVESNPLLEWSEEAPIEVTGEHTSREQSEQATPGTDAESDANWDTLDLPDWASAPDEWSAARGSRDGDDDEDAAARQIVEESLHDHLLWQLRLSHLGPRDMQIGMALIDAIDNDGYMREPLDAIARLLAPDFTLDADDILPVLRLIQQFDPVAVGSRDLAECLALQIAQLPADTPARNLARRIAEQAIERLPKIGSQGVASEFRCSVAEAEAAIELLRTLDPRPGAQIGGIDHDTYVIPDAVIWRQRGRWQAALAGNGRPPININREYAKIAAETAGNDGQYLRGCLQEARWFLKNIEQRGETLLRVVQCLLREQAGFLEFGPQALRPLTLREVAEKLELHESTISRAIARKHVRTARGTVSLRDFFASGVEHDGVAASSTAIQSMIRGLIEQENPRKPLSDAALTTQLKQAGVTVARRTVAKYREAMQIAASSERVRL